MVLHLAVMLVMLKMRLYWDIKYIYILSKLASLQISYRDLVVNKNVSKISIIGVGMITTPGVTYRMFQTLANKGINILVISTSEIKISVLIDKKNIKKALLPLHKEFKLNN